MKRSLLLFGITLFCCIQLPAQQVATIQKYFSNCFKQNPYFFHRNGYGDTLSILEYAKGRTIPAYHPEADSDDSAWTDEQFNLAMYREFFNEDAFEMCYCDDKTPYTSITYLGEESACDVLLTEVVRKDAKGKFKREIQWMTFYVREKEDAFRPLVKFRYSDLRPWLSKRYWHHPYNEADSCTFAEAFEQNRYTIEKFTISDAKQLPLYNSSTKIETKSPDKKFQKYLDKEKTTMTSLLVWGAVPVKPTPVSYQDYEVTLTLDRTNPLACPLNTTDDQKTFTAAIIRAVKEKKLKPYSTNYSPGGKNVPLQDGLFEMLIHESLIDEWGNEVEREYAAINYTIGITQKLRLYSDGKSEIRNEEITLIFIPDKKPVAKFRYDDVVRILKNSGLRTWYNPWNNADSCTVADAIESNRYPVSGISIDGLSGSESVFRSGMPQHDQWIFNAFHAGIFYSDTTTLVAIDTIKNIHSRNRLMVFKQLLVDSQADTVQPQSWKARSQGNMYNKYSVLTSLPLDTVYNPEFISETETLVSVIRKAALNNWLPTYYNGKKLSADSFGIRINYSGYLDDTFEDMLSHTKVDLTQTVEVKNGQKTVGKPDWMYLYLYEQRDDGYKACEVKYTDLVQYLESSSDKFHQQMAAKLKTQTYKSTVNSLTDLSGTSYFANGDNSGLPENFKNFVREWR